MSQNELEIQNSHLRHLVLHLSRVLLKTRKHSIKEKKSQCKFYGPSSKDNSYQAIGASVITDNELHAECNQRYMELDGISKSNQSKHDGILAAKEKKIINLNQSLTLLHSEYSAHKQSCLNQISDLSNFVDSKEKQILALEMILKESQNKWLLMETYLTQTNLVKKSFIGYENDDNILLNHQDYLSGVKSHDISVEASNLIHSRAWFSQTNCIEAKSIALQTEMDNLVRFNHEYCQSEVEFHDISIDTLDLIHFHASFAQTNVTDVRHIALQTPKECVEIVDSATQIIQPQVEDKSFQSADDAVTVYWDSGIQFNTVMSKIATQTISKDFQDATTQINFSTLESKQDMPTQAFNKRKLLRMQKNANIDIMPTIPMHSELFLTSHASLEASLGQSSLSRSLGLELQSIVAQEHSTLNVLDASEWKDVDEPLSFDDMDVNETQMQTIKQMTIQSLEMTADTVKFLQSMKKKPNEPIIDQQYDSISKMRSYSIQCLAANQSPLI